MTLQEIEQKVTEQDGVFKAEIAALKSENEVLTEVNKMSEKHKKAFNGFSAEKKKAYMAMDAEKRKAMMDEETKEPDEDDAEKAKKREAVAKAEAVRKAQDERIAKLETENAAILKRERLAHFTAIAKAELPHNSGTDVEKGQRLMTLADTLGGETGADYKAMFATLKSASDLLGNTAFKEIGKWGGGNGDEPEAILEAKGVEIAKRDKVTKEQGYVIACEENPDLYTRAQEQFRSAHRG